MYTSFFGLNEKPFTITPDPRYLYMSERHGEGLAHLVYGVTDSGGFIQLTGEVGTGKTTLVRTLLGQIPAEVDIALILNPHLTAVEFLTAICEELSIALPAEKGSAKALVDALNRHLLDVHSQGRRIILLVDEAQNLADDVLEQLRLLTNLETARQKLLQIILIAQPELREKLAQKSLRQLAQRVTGRYHLEPLTRDEASDYVDHRLRVAGALTEIFTPAAKREIYRLSGGVPRIINVICDRALLGAYTREARTIGKRLVRKAASEVSGQTVRPAALKWLAPVLGIASLMLAGTVLWDVLERPADTPDPIVSVAAEPVVPAAVVSEPVPDTRSADMAALLTTNSNTRSFHALLRRWGIDIDVSGGNACEQAEASGLHCYSQRGTWSTLQQLDRPVVLSLRDDDGLTHQVALVELDENTANLSVGDEIVAVPMEALSRYWFGQFILVWRPVNGNDQAIGPGMRNEDVRWLRNSLAALDTSYQPAADNADVYDAELEQQIIAFQRRHRLEADGLAGQKTQIIINSLLALDDTPRLISNH